MAPSTRKADLAAQVWQQLFDFFLATRPERDRVLERLDLTPNDARTMASLELREGRTMRELAKAWGCDPSNATWIVERMVARGLAERRAKPGDRRVKLITLTPKGTRVREQLLEGMRTPPRELLGLSLGDLTELRQALAKLPPSPGRDPMYRLPTFSGR
jgi:DNA-binding MarR family transcriptional regulator